MATAKTLSAGEYEIEGVCATLKLTYAPIIGNIASNNYTINSAITKILESINKSIFISGVSKMHIAQDTELYIRFARKAALKQAATSQRTKRTYEKTP
jgi:hypothetical protein